MAIRIFGFKGGVHPDERKHLTATHPVKDVELPKIVYLPIIQHIGAPSKIVVSKGDEVRKGDVIAEPGGYVSVAIHASVSGKVRAIEKVNHPLGMRVDAVVIESDGEDRWGELKPVKGNPLDADADELRNIICRSGIVGLGGATFPTHVKLNPPGDKKIDTLILNGCECEPYLSADHRLMLENAESILRGMAVAMRILELKRAIVAIEENKMDAVENMKKAVEKLGKELFDGSVQVDVVNLPVKYPQGAEKQLIRALLGREVPSGGLPMDVGALVHNVGTMFSVFHAVYEGKPLIERVVTSAGDGIKNPGNYRVRFGMMIRDFVEATGGLKEGVEIKKLIVGGPMMGIAQWTDEVPIIKSTSGILFFTHKDCGKQRQESSCIRCGRCISVCPINLNPTTLVRFVKLGMFDELLVGDSLDCIECGSCTFGCPASIPLVQYIKVAKGKMMEMRRKKKAG